MANTLSVMIRSVVSKKRRRFTEDGYDLDLAYICHNIIAMGYPGENFQSVFRNPMNDVCHFFEFRHKEHYKVYNLRSEKAYDVNKFHGRVSVYAFEDHNPPTIELIDKFCYDVDHWLKEHPKNVAAIHCKAGKGRTGTMICCYLLYSGIKTTAEDALSYYGEKRTKNKKGVTIPSQRRYVQYYARLTRSNIKYEKRTFQLCEIRFTSAPALQNQGSVQCLISTMEEIDCTESRAYKANDSDCAGTSTKVTVKELIKFPIDFRKTFNLVLEDQLVLVTGDVKVELKKFFHFWFNTYFVCDTAEKQGEGEDMKLIYTLPKWELDDAHKDKEHKLFREDFKVKLVLKPFKPSPPHSRNNVDGGGEMPQMRQHNNHNNHVNSLMHNSLNNTNMLLTHGATSSKSGDSTIDYHNYIQHQAERSKKPISLPPFSPLASGGGIAGGSNHLQNLTHRHHQQQLQQQQQQQQLKRSSEPTPSVYPESINRSNNIYHNNRSHHHPHQQQLQLQLQQQPQSQQQQPQQQQQQQKQSQAQPQPQPQQHTHHFHYQRPRVHDTQQQHQNQNQNQQQLQLQSQLQNNSTSSSNIHNVSSNSNSSSSSSISSQSSSSSSAGVGGGGGDGGGEEDWESENHQSKEILINNTPIIVSAKAATTTTTGKTSSITTSSSSSSSSQPTTSNTFSTTTNFLLANHHNFNSTNLFHLNELFCNKKKSKDKDSNNGGISIKKRNCTTTATTPVKNDKFSTALTTTPNTTATDGTGLVYRQDTTNLPLSAALKSMLSKNFKTRPRREST